MGKPMTLRTVISTGLVPGVDLDKPLLVRLGLGDPRVIPAGSWSSYQGHHIVTLADAGPWLGVVRDTYMNGFVVTPAPSEEALLGLLGRRNGRPFVGTFLVDGQKNGRSDR
jgi:hypothetical protein